MLSCHLHSGAESSYNNRLRGGRGRFPYNVGEHLIVELQTFAFGDGCGTRNRPYTVVCAYIGKPWAWNSMNLDWEAVYKAKGLREVHAVELFSRRHYVKASSNNPYKDWSLYDVKVFIDALATAVHKHQKTIRPISIVVNNLDFHSLSHREKRLLTTGRFLHWNHRNMQWLTSGKPSEPYMLVVQTLMKRVFEISDQRSRVHFVFDRQETDGITRNLVRQIINRKIWPEYPRMGDFTAGDSAQHPGIQMADVHAYLLNRYVLSQSGQLDRARVEEEYALAAISGLTEEYEMISIKEMRATLEANADPQHDFCTRLASLGDAPPAG